MKLLKFVIPMRLHSIDLLSGHNSVLQHVNVTSRPKLGAAETIQIKVFEFLPHPEAF